MGEQVYWPGRRRIPALRVADLGYNLQYGRQLGDGLKLSPEEWRKQSLERAVSLGYPPAIPLPIIDEFIGPRPRSEVLGRLLGLHGVLTAAFGLERRKVRSWLERENVWKCLTPEERTFVDEGSENLDHFQIRIEASWALAWALGLVDELNFADYCGRQFALMMPDIEKDERGDRLRAAARLRSFDEIAGVADLAYCLHWAIIEVMKYGKEPPGKVRPYVIWQRRRALEWVLSDHAWDDVPMDT